MPDSTIQHEVLELTKDLIRIRSTHSRPDEIIRCAEFIENWLARHEIRFTHTTVNGVPAITVLPRDQQVPLLLMTHFDVVEVADEALFSPFEQEGRLHGRGAIDDKYAVALSLVLFKEHLNRLKKDGLHQSDMVFGLLMTGDEEIGGANGAGKACQLIDTDFFIAIDGGHPGLIVSKEKGILQLQLSATGKAAHAARPWLGNSAFDMLVSDYAAIQRLFRAQSPDHWHKTAVLTRCSAGNGSTNIVPDKASAILDIRFTENDDPGEIISSIRKAVSSTVTVNANEPVFASGPSPFIDLLVQHAQDARVGFEHGASDARYLATRGIPGVIYGAEGGMSQHTENEHLVIDSLYSLYTCFDNFLTDIQHRRR